MWYFRFSVRFYSVLAAVLLSLNAVAQSDNPKIGLVLGGGGARGAAHVGVIKVLEANNIPVHAVVGTSMGAIIGGLYASGMRADEIEDLLKAIDWEDAFTDDQPRPELSFRRKEDDLSFLIDFDLGINTQGILLPKGLVQGQKQNRIFRQVLEPVLSIDDFDQLPIPFRAIATDIESGEAAVLKSGSLVAAMRASMSIPAAFAPVEINGRLLVDGGISNNLPIDIARQMGVDVLIVVDVSEALSRKEDLDTPLSITNQVTSVFIKQNTHHLIKTLTDKDLLIRPELGDMASSDFHRAVEAIQSGQVAAEFLMNKLEHLSTGDEQYNQFKNHHQKDQHRDSILITYIEIVSDSKISSEVIRARIRIKENEPLNLIELENDIARVFGLEYFELVDAQIIKSNEGYGIKVVTKKKSWGPNYLNFGIDFSDDFGGGSEYNFTTRFTMTELNALAAEWRTDIQIGEVPRLWSEFYQPLTKESRVFIAPSLDLQQSTVNSFEDGHRIAEFRLTTRTIDFDIGYEFSNWAEMRVGVLQGGGEVRLRTGNPAVFEPERRFDIGQYFFRFRYDQLNNVRFPREGSRFEFDANYSRSRLSADDEYDLYRMSWTSAISKGHYTLVTRLAMGTVNHFGQANIESQFKLGGFLNLSGLNTGELVGPHFAIGNLIAYRKIPFSEEAFFNMPLYIGASLELGNVWPDKSNINMENTITAGSIFIGADTFLGPIYLAGGLSEGGDSSLYFFLGRSF